MHVDAVRRSVPAGQWCSGHTAGEVAPSRWNPFKRKK
jgi:hypothetical protein